MGRPALAINIAYTDSEHGRSTYFAHGCGHIVRHANIRYCSDCHADRPKRSRREEGLLGRYGITLIDFDNKGREQRGLCEICQKRPAKVVDHNHRTGSVRGILCGGCNTAIGVLDEDFVSATAYIAKYKDK